MKYTWLFQDVFEVQKNSIQKGQKVVIVDDLLATGGKLNIQMYGIFNTVLCNSHCTNYTRYAHTIKKFEGILLRNIIIVLACLFFFLRKKVEVFWSLWRLHWHCSWRYCHCLHARTLKVITDEHWLQLAVLLLPIVFFFWLSACSDLCLDMYHYWLYNHVRLCLSSERVRPFWLFHTMFTRALKDFKSILV